MFKLSVIIPTYNRAFYLKKALESLCFQTLSIDDFEVLVIDNGSTDNTKEIAHNFKLKLNNLRYFYEKEPGLHIGRHSGLKNSESQIIVYCDDDIEALPEWLEGIWESFQDEKVVLVGGNNYPKYEIEPPCWVQKLWNKTAYGKSLGYLSLIDFGNHQKEIPASYVWGCNFSIRKNVLIEAGGFHPDGTCVSSSIKELFGCGDGESWVSNYITQKKYKVIFNPKASVYHCIPKERLTLEYFKRRAFQQGISDSYSQIRNEYIFKRKSLPQKTFFNQCAALKRRIKTKLYLIKIFLKDYEVYKIKKTLKKSYDEGKNYHKRAVEKDKVLFNWVIKENYLD